MEVYISTVEERKELSWFDQFPLDSEWEIDGRKTRLKADISGGERPCGPQFTEPQ